jgi:hypothetical protein
MVACATLFLANGLIASPAVGQSEAGPEAPWQAHPCQGQHVPPPDCPTLCGSDCGNDCGGEACGKDQGRCDDECSVTAWCHWPVFEPCGQLSFRGEYLGWWTKSSPLPALATTSQSPTTPRAQAGVIGQPGTEILFSGDDGDQGVHSGVRLALGCWFTPCRESGLDVSYMALGNKAAAFAGTSADTPILARPFVNVTTGLQDSLIIAYPAQQTGTLDVRDANELNSVEVLFRRGVLRQCNRELDLLIGYRYGRFNESIAIDQASHYLVTVGSIPAGTVITASDLFSATNDFSGGEIGFVARTHYCRWSLELLTKLAVGNTHSRTDISGNTVVTPPPTSQQPVQNHNAGVLALPTNIGTFERNDFSVIPEFGLTLGYDLTCRLKATFGWSFLYWSSVMRPADQIDSNVNPTQLPPGTLRGFAAPAFRPVTTDFWAQGFNVGLEYRY